MFSRLSSVANQPPNVGEPTRRSTARSPGSLVWATVIFSEAAPAVSPQPLPQRVAQFRQRDPDLGHLVTRPDGGRLVLLGFEIDGDREGRADLVLPSIAFADRLRV